MQLQSEVNGGKYRGLSHLAVTLPRSPFLLLSSLIEPVLWLILWEAFSCRRSEIFEIILNKVTREEGLAALWKGHLPAQALSVTYGFAR